MQTSKRVRQVRELLREFSDGLTVNEIRDMVPAIDQSHLSRILRAMPDSYIDRWTNGSNSRTHRAVWCVVVPPDDCPRPYRTESEMKRGRK